MSSLALMSEPRVVASSADQIDRSIERTAIRFVKTWGFTTVEMVAARFRMLSRAPAPRASLTRQALRSLPDLQWLDPTREWFSLLDRDSAMRASLEKILGVVGVVEPDELALALGKRHSFGVAPPAVVSAYVEALSSRVSRQGFVSENAALTTEEHVVLEALRHAGGLADLAELRQATRGFISVPAMTRALQTSPLFLRVGRGKYRVVGAQSWPIAPALTLSLPWRAAV
jgi:hypothetical protein